MSELNFILIFVYDLIKIISFSSIPKYFIWLKYLSWFGYANEILVINQWKGVTGIECSSNTTFCFTNGEQIITYLKVKEVSSLIYAFSKKTEIKFFNFLRRILI